jgi:HK97 family phage prohead protease
MSKALLAKEAKMQKPNITIPLEVKGLKDREFDGHGSIFKNVDLGGDIVVPGAFKRSLAQHKDAGSLPAMFWMHDAGKVPGKWTDMHEDEKGLAVKGVLAPTPLGDEVHTLLKMEAVSGMSIGYRTLDHDYDSDGNRLIKEAELWEVSVVSLPMNPLAQVVHVKSQLSERGEFVPSVREFERILRDVGCSKTVAKSLVHKIYEGEESENRWDADNAELEAAEAVAAKLFIASIESKLPKF